jgi:hypothetical protein
VNRIHRISFAALLLGAVATTAETESSFATPEGAIRALENAYRNRDIEAAVAAKDFNLEARLMLENKNPAFAQDKDLVAKAAETLELSYRAHIKKLGFPDFNDVSCEFTGREQRSESVVLVTEVCQHPDGGSSKERLLVGKTPRGWRVLNPEN